LTTSPIRTHITGETIPLAQLYI